MTPDEVLAELREHRKELWELYRDSPHGGALEALRQGKFEGFDRAVGTIADHLPRLIAEAEERGAARVRERVEAARRELVDTARPDSLRVSRALIALGEDGPALLAALGGDA